MKSILKYLIALICIVVAAISCKKDGTAVYATSGVAGTLTASTTTPALSHAGTYEIILDIPNSKYTLTKQ
ncbi:MAG: hypothetical protein QM610_02935 [Chitinophagaceae bacterium]